jgi:hypothetical protein
MRGKLTTVADYQRIFQLTSKLFCYTDLVHSAIAYLLLFFSLLVMVEEGNPLLHDLSDFHLAAFCLDYFLIK